MLYHKIQNIFNRSTETRKLIEGNFRDESLEYLKDTQWIFTEKVDGTNIRIMWDGHKVSIGGRTEAAQIPQHLLNKLSEYFLTPEAEEIFEAKFGEKEVVIFGEGYGKKIQSGENYGDVDFIVFDVSIGRMWLKREGIEGIASSFGVKCVPVVLKGTLNDGVEYVKQKPNSTIAERGKPMEGIIGVPAYGLSDRRGNRIVVKIKARDF
jgi:ATP-dependent RNA circularization protein (DNA/RNA ligase family)